MDVHPLSALLRVCAQVEAHLRRVSATVAAYVASVCDSLKKNIPKAVVHCQVLQAKKSLLTPLYQQVGGISEEQLEQLLGGASRAACVCGVVAHALRRACVVHAEDPDAVQRRVACTQRLAMLRRAREEISAAMM